MNSSKIYQLVGLFILSFIFGGCSSSEIGESKDVSQDKIYQQYDISYTEGDKTASIFSQFRFAGNKGTTLVLSKPSKVELDDSPIKVDSSTYSGAFYPTSLGISGLYGKHHFVFTDINNKKYSNEFVFESFKLVNIPASAAKNQPLTIHYETTPLVGDDYITIAATNTDSSFSVSHNVSDLQGSINIPASELQRQKSQHITLVAKLHRRRPLQQTTSEGGNLSIDYTLKPVTIELK